MRLSIRLLLIALPVLTLTTVPLLSLNFPIAAVAQTVEERKAEGERLVEQGNQQLQANQFQEALQTYQQALEIYRAIGDRTQEIVVLTSIGSVLLIQGSVANIQGQPEQAAELYSQAMSVLQEGLTVAQEANDQSQEAALLYTIGDVLAGQAAIAATPEQATELYAQAVETYQQGLTIIRTANDRTQEVTFLQAIGDTLSLQGTQAVERGSPEQVTVLSLQAIEFYQQGVEIVRTIDDRIREGYLLNAIGSNYHTLGLQAYLTGKYTEAQQFYLDGAEKVQAVLTIAEEANDLVLAKAALTTYAQIYLTLGQTYLQLEQPFQAKEAFENSLEAFRRNLESAETIPGENALLVPLERSALLGLLQAYSAVSREYNSRNQHTQVLETEQQSLAIAEELDDQNRQAIILGSIAAAYNNLGQYPQALETCQKMLSFTREINNVNRTAEALNCIGRIHSYQARYAQALTAYEEALTLSQVGSEPATVFTTLGFIGEIHVRQAKYGEAMQVLQQAVEISRELQDRFSEVTSENLPEICAILNLSATSAAGIFDYLGNMNLSNGFRTTCENLNLQNGNHLFNLTNQLAQTLSNLGRWIEGFNLSLVGSVHSNQGNYPQALEYYNQSLSIAREVGNRDGEAGALNNIANVYGAQGNYEQALTDYQQALEIYREVQSRSGESVVLGNQAGVYDSLGRYNEALQTYEQALAISRELGEPSSEAGLLDRLADYYIGRGQYPEALATYEQALALSREIGEPSREASVLNGLGGLYRVLGQFDRALSYQQQALAVFQEIGEPFGEADTLRAIGATYRQQNQQQEALNSYQQAWNIFRDIDSQTGKSVTLQGLGQLYEEQAEYSKALESLQQALNIQQQIGTRPYQGQTLNIIGRIQTQLGQYDRAAHSLQQALDVTRAVGDEAGEATVLRDQGKLFAAMGNLNAAETVLSEAIDRLESLRSGLSDSEQVSIFELQASTYATLQTVFVEQGKTELALETAERGRARALVDLLSNRIAPDNNHSEPPSFTSVTEKSGINFNPSTAQIQQIASAQNATLVQYSVIENRHLYIWVIKPTGEINFESVDLSNIDRPLSELVQTSRQAIGARGREPGTITVVPTAEAQQQQQAEQRQNLQQLHKLLIEPIAQYLPTNESDRVIFIPQGELFLVPFPALMDANGEYLIENHTILTAPSIQVLDLTRQQRQRLGQGSPNGDEMLVVGNPIMPEIWNPTTGETEQLDALKGAEDEAIDIAENFETQPLLWDQATETIVKQRMQNARIIHLATHGLLEYGDPRESGVRDFPGAIALAPSTQDDGLLTAAELYEMDLNAELVVLSACDTGRGNITGDGVIGLSRSLMQAGVPSVIVSLWKVPDDSTQFLMTRFYEHWETTPDKAQALRQAMRDTMAEYPDPLNWAAFTLIGEAE